MRQKKTKKKKLWLFILIELAELALPIFICKIRENNFKKTGEEI